MPLVVSRTDARGWLAYPAAMKQLIVQALAAALFLPACSQDSSASTANPDASTVGQFVDQSTKAAEQTATMDNLKSSFGELNSLLGGITDGASASSAKGALEGAIGKLQTQLGELGKLGKLPPQIASLKDSLMKTALDHVQRLMGNLEVQQAIGPVLAKLKGVLGG